ncbi:hypothetical protein QJQ45_014161 [Haematococcus lacustris]|nr:hypothetical protein QJQ45_014161 [Haematococcus lacustris]
MHTSGRAATPRVPLSSSPRPVVVHVRQPQPASCSRGSSAPMPPIPTAIPTTSHSQEFEDFVDYIQTTQQAILSAAEALDGSGCRFLRDQWQRNPADANAGAEGCRASLLKAAALLPRSHAYVTSPWLYCAALPGWGATCVLEGGRLLEKAAANTTVVRGTLSAARAQAMSSRGRTEVDPQGGQAYAAAALSLVFHCANPLVPTLRADVRCFQVAGQSWFGGGCDLTPFYLYEEDAVAFHNYWKGVCDKHQPGLYPRLKQWCDSYFHIPARGEHRGIGGIFYDDLSSSDGGFDAAAFTQDVGRGILPSWQHIAETRGGHPFTQAEREWQLLRRGRYLEFNLLYDRGVRFGLDGGRMESIMVSAPPLIAWNLSVLPLSGFPLQRNVDKQPAERYKGRTAEVARPTCRPHPFAVLTCRFNGKASFVDESLFGPSKSAGGEKPQVEEKKTVLPPVHRSLSPRNEAVTVTQKDLERMLKSSPVMTADDKAAMRREQNQKREEAQAVSKARKEHMLRLAEEAKKKAPETETDRIKAAANAKIKTRAEYLLEEQKDEVKHMNQMVLYSKCVTIRDAQIEEKKQMMLEAEEENRRQDQMMEVERIKALEQYEARERQRVEERKRGAKVLEEQIQERERERIRQEELRDQERLMMLKEMERLKEEELAAAIEKKLAAKAMLEEVAAANSEQIRRKELLKPQCNVSAQHKQVHGTNLDWAMMQVREKQEDLKILEYTRAKDARDLEIAMEKERIAKEKEMETARLRAMQERAADKQAELDELRARRYQEAKEREWRTKERSAAERSAALMAELAQAREAQKASKLTQRAEVARVEHDEFMRVLAVNRAKEAEDMAMATTQAAIHERYKEELLAQISTNEEKRKVGRLTYLEEGRRIRQAAEAEKAALAEIKARKLAQLTEVGVPSKYRAELEKYKVGAA